MKFPPSVSHSKEQKRKIGLVHEERTRGIKGLTDKHDKERTTKENPAKPTYSKKYHNGFTILFFLSIFLCLHQVRDYCRLPKCVFSYS